MDHVVAVPYELFPSPEAFVDAWNGDPDCVAVAVATPAPPAPQQYGVEVLEAFLVVLGSVASGVAGNALYDLLTDRVCRQSGVRVTYRETTFPDGTHVTELVRQEDAPGA